MVSFRLFLSRHNVFVIELIICLSIFVFPMSISTENGEKNEVADEDDTINFDPHRDFYEFEVQDIKGNTVNLRRYSEKVSLVVNVASNCGYTDTHYKELVKLQTELGLTDKFHVLAFPCNQFDNQEPGTNSEIEQFVKRKYQVNFPLFAKINVINEDVPEAWKFLIAEAGEEPTGNFWKYLVGGDGHVINAWGPAVGFNDIRHHILDAVETLTHPDLPYQHDYHEHEEL